VLCSNAASTIVLSNSNNPIHFDTVKVDQDPTGQSIWDSANYQFVCRTPGWYFCRLMIGYNPSTALGTVQSGWELNGVQFMQTNRQNKNSDQSWACPSVVFLSVEDLLRPFAWWIPQPPTTGTGINLNNFSEVPNASIRMVSL
jgi:hypothetical protein